MFVLIFLVSDRASFRCCMFDLKHFDNIYHFDAPFGSVRTRTIRIVMRYKYREGKTTKGHNANVCNGYTCDAMSTKIKQNINLGIRLCICQAVTTHRMPLPATVFSPLLHFRRKWPRPSAPHRVTTAYLPVPVQSEI